ncbi:hypothetical protein Esti_000912 [Eimeria stiedai]
MSAKKIRHITAFSRSHLDQLAASTARMLGFHCPVICTGVDTVRHPFRAPTRAKGLLHSLIAECLTSWQNPESNHGQQVSKWQKGVQNLNASEKRAPDEWHSISQPMAVRPSIDQGFQFAYKKCWQQHLPGILLPLPDLSISQIAQIACYASVSGIAEHVLEAPSAHPGPHNCSQGESLKPSGTREVIDACPAAGRTDPDLLPLDPRRQLLLVWDCMCEWIQEQLQNGRSVAVKGFGTFAFERSVKQNPPAVRELNHVGKEVESVHPRFVLAPELAAETLTHPTKNGLEKNYTGGSIFQAKNMQFLNFVPIAASCYLDTAVVASALKAVFSAIQNLARNSYDLVLQFKFCVVRLTNKTMSCTFDPSLKCRAQATVDSRKAAVPVPVKNAWSLCGGNTSTVSYLGQAVATQESRAPGMTLAQSLSKQLALVKRQQASALRALELILRLRRANVV